MQPDNVLAKINEVLAQGEGAAVQFVRDIKPTMLDTGCGFGEAVEVHLWVERHFQPGNASQTHHAGRAAWLP